MVSIPQILPIVMGITIIEGVINKDLESYNVESNEKVFSGYNYFKTEISSG